MNPYCGARPDRAGLLCRPATNRDHQIRNWRIRFGEFIPAFRKPIYHVMFLTEQQQNRLWVNPPTGL
jgi:hypothetical protein